MNKMENYDHLEPILNDDSNKNRFTVFPIKYPELFNMYNKHKSSFWTEEEINLANDKDDWNNKLTENERFYIKHILAFFAGSDGIVMENLANRFSYEVKIPEARLFYAFQTAMEAIHSVTYSLLIDTYIDDDEEKIELFNAIDNFPAIKKKAEWSLRWINDSDSFAERLVAFAIVEGVFFSGAFCSIYWIKERGIMHGLTSSNELISTDESLHTEFAVKLYKLLNRKLSQEKIYEILDEGVEIEKEFITESLPCDLIGMNAELMKKYIEYVADRLLVQLGYNKLYGTENTMPHMTRICLDQKTNFFENTNLNYSRANVCIDNGNDDDDDF